MTNAKKNPVDGKINPVFAIIVFAVAVFTVVACVSFIPSDNAAENDYECLNFTFPDGGGHLSLSVKGSINPDCQYRIGAEGEWAVLPKEGTDVGGGKTVYIKGSNATGFSVSRDKYATFVLTVNKSSQTVSSSGSVMSLINGDGNDTVIPCDYCFYHLFYECAALSSAPALPATTIKDYCYESMFKGCTSLTEAPELKAKVLALACYTGMFSNCTSLTEAPDLPATKMAQACYGQMFSNSGLETAPELPATELADHCYVGMFESCGSLRVAPALPATELANSCYMNMFIFCGNLSSAPILPAKDLVNGCYMSMFSNCTNIERISCLAETMSDGSTIDWIGNVSATGRFYTPNPEIWEGKDIYSGIPKNWTVNEAAIDPNGGSFDDGSWTYHEDTGKYTKEFSGGTTWASIISAEESHLSRTGYDLGGWDPQPGPTEYLGFPCTDIKALWMPHSFDVTLDSRGGSVSPGKIHVTYDSPYGELPVPVKTGYAFAGWFTATEGGSEVTSATICKTDGEHTLHAHWTVNTENIVLNSGYEGGTAGAATVYYDSDSFEEIDILTRTGYTLLGYYDGNIKVVSADGTFASDNVPGWIENGKWKKDGKNIALTAKWEANEYAVTFYANGGEPESQTVTETFDSNYILPSKPTKVGHTFIGWFTAETGGTEVTSGTKVKITAPQTLYAHWKVNKYTITFDTDGGSHVEPIIQDYGTDVYAPENPTKKGHTFNGWDRDIPQTMPAENITIKALWTLNSVEITFDANDRTEQKKVQTITYGVGDMRLSPCEFEPKKDNTHYFAWNTESDGTGTWYMDKQSMEEYLETNAGTLMLYAQWSIETKSDKGVITPGDTITFIVSASEYPSEVWVSGKKLTDTQYEVKKLQSNGEIQVTLLSNYTQELTNGRYIIGIYFETSVGYCGFDVSSPTPRTVFPVIYYSNGGSAPAPEAYNAYLGETITVASYSGTKDGYAFGGWLYNGVNIVKPGEKIEVKEPITLTAVWIFVPEGSHTVSFDTDGGSDSPSAITVGEGCTFTVPEYKGTKGGYTFKGWSYDEKTYKAGDTVRMEKSDIVMKAVWKKNPEPAPENNTGMIVGVAVGIIAAVALIGGAVFFVRKK